jgi:hypothetical protein
VRRLDARLLQKKRDSPNNAAAVLAAVAQRQAWRRWAAPRGARSGGLRLASLARRRRRPSRHRLSVAASARWRARRSARRTGACHLTPQPGMAAPPAASSLTRSRLLWQPFLRASEWRAAGSSRSLLPASAQPERGYAAAAARACPCGPAPPAARLRGRARSRNPGGDANAPLLRNQCLRTRRSPCRRCRPPCHRRARPSRRPVNGGAAADTALCVATDSPSCVTLLLAAPQGNISKWRKREGDKIAAGDVLADIETARGLCTARVCCVCASGRVSGSRFVSRDIRTRRRWRWRRWRTASWPRF